MCGTIPKCHTKTKTNTANKLKPTRKSGRPETGTSDEDTAKNTATGLGIL